MQLLHFEVGAALRQDWWVAGGSLRGLLADDKLATVVGRCRRELLLLQGQMTVVAEFVLVVPVLDVGVQENGRMV